MALGKLRDTTHEGTDEESIVRLLHAIYLFAKNSTITAAVLA